jgi:intracellular sulfur oxidation DsrE/DsrF family protein
MEETMIQHRFKGMLFVLLTLPGVVLASDSMPWGAASLQEKDYAPQQVVYDVAVPDAERMNSLLGRVSHLNTVYEADPFDAHIVLVLHGPEIPLFAIENHEENRELMERAQSLTNAGNIDIRMCAAAAGIHGYEPDEIHGFVDVVPMADAEIIELLHDGYVYMR